MGEKFLEVLVSNSASCIVGALFAYLNYQIREMQSDRKKKAEAEAQARDRQEKVDLWLLRGELKRSLQYHIEVNYVSREALATLEEGYSLYQSMGGNGEIKIYMESVRELKHDKE